MHVEGSSLLLTFIVSLKESRADLTPSLYYNLINFSLNRQCYSKHSSLAWRTFCADASFVSLNNRVNDGKAKTETFPLLFGAEKRIKNLR